MRVTIEIPVITWGAKRANSANKKVVASVPRVFDIPEYASTDAPVVLAHVTESRDANGERSLHRREYFGIDGNLYTDRQVGAFDDLAVRLHYPRYAGGHVPHPYFGEAFARIHAQLHAMRKADYSAFRTAVLPSSLNKFVTGEEFGASDTQAIERLDGLSLARWGKDDVEVQVALFERRMEKFAVIDGNVVMREDEPLIAFRAEHPSPTVDVIERRESVTVRGLNRWSRGGPSSWGYMSLADAGDLAGRIEALAWKMTDPVNRVVEVEVADASYLRASSAAATLVDAAETMRRKFIAAVTVTSEDSETARARTGDVLEALDEAAFSAFKALVRGLDESDETSVSPTLEGAVELAAASGGRKNFGDEKLLSHAIEAVEAWRNRSIGLEMEFSPRMAARR
jgi:hypothetical protein